MPNRQPMPMPKAATRCLCLLEPPAAAHTHANAAGRFLCREPLALLLPRSPAVGGTCGGHGPVGRCLPTTEPIPARLLQLNTAALSYPRTAATRLPPCSRPLDFQVLSCCGTATALLSQRCTTGCLQFCAVAAARHSGTAIVLLLRRLHTALRPQYRTAALNCYGSFESAPPRGPAAALPPHRGCTPTGALYCYLTAVVPKPPFGRIVIAARHHCGVYSHCTTDALPLLRCTPAPHCYCSELLRHCTAAAAPGPDPLVRRCALRSRHSACCRARVTTVRNSHHVETVPAALCCCSVWPLPRANLCRVNIADAPLASRCEAAIDQRRLLRADASGLASWALLRSHSGWSARRGYATLLPRVLAAAATLRRCRARGCCCCTCSVVVHAPLLLLLLY